jgi:hypothetical protein
MDAADIANLETQHLHQVQALYQNVLTAEQLRV